MKNKTIFTMLFVLILFSFSAALKGQTKPDFEKNSWLMDSSAVNWVWLGTGTLTPGSFDLNGVTRTYNEYAPKDYAKKSRPKSIVFALHGLGSDSGLTMRGFGLEILADNEGFIIVYPDGLLPPAKGEPGYSPNWYRGWNAGHCCNYANIKGVDDVLYLDVLIDIMLQKYNIDPKRIYIMGASNGGMMAYRYAAERSEKVAAIAPLLATHGGLTDGTRKFWMVPNPSRPVPLIAFNCMYDDVVPYRGSSEYLSTGETMGFWARSNGCQMVPEYTWNPENGGYLLSSFSCPQVEALFYCMLYEKHTWPFRFESEKSLKAEQVTKLIWDFFKTHPPQPPQPPVPPAPENFTAERVISKSVFLRRYNNKISWSAVPDGANSGFEVEEYILKVGEGEDDSGLETLATFRSDDPSLNDGIVSKAGGPRRFIFWHKVTKNDVRYRYVIYAVSTEGVIGDQAVAVIEAE